MICGFFNIPMAQNEQIGAHGEFIKVDLLGTISNASIQTSINRTSNNNGTPRIYLGAEYTNWLSLNHQVGDNLQIHIVSPSHIQLS